MSILAETPECLAEMGGITPETKLADLLERYPRLEQVLIDLSPTFAQLRNPVLRKPVAKVARLRQIAEVAGVPIGDLVERLRFEVGTRDGGPKYEDELVTHGEQVPGWLTPDAVAQSLDARPILDAGGHPLAEVMQGLTKLQDGQVYELITPFVPAPLLNVALEKGYKSWTRRESADVVRTYFTKD